MSGGTLRTKYFTKYLFYFLGLLVVALLSGCAGPTYTTDDGSPVDEKLLSNIRLYGKAERTIREPVVKTEKLVTPDCTTQWDFPFVLATSYDLPQEEKIAWVRGLNVDERLTVVAAAEYTGLKPGDKIIAVNGDKDDADDLIEELDDILAFGRGREFSLTVADGRKVRLKPIELCRGHVEVTKPAKPDAQNYHWLEITHPMYIFDQDLTPDEAMWIVLWTKGLSAEAGARMMTYHYGLKIVRTAVTVASIASGVGAAANAASAAAANIAASEAGKAAAAAAGKEVAKYAAEQVAYSLKKTIVEEALKEAAKAAAQEIATGAIINAGLFKSSLSGISWVAGTGFYMADKWALDRMELMGADPLAAYTLHFKLASRGLADNAFVFDEERFGNMVKYAEEKGFGVNALLALNGGYGNPTIDTGTMVKEDAQTSPVEGSTEPMGINTAYEVEVLPVEPVPAVLPVGEAPVAAPEVEPAASEPAPAIEAIPAGEVALSQ